MHNWLCLTLWRDSMITNKSKSGWQVPRNVGIPMGLLYRINKNKIEMRMMPGPGAVLWVPAKYFWNKVSRMSDTRFPRCWVIRAHSTRRDTPSRPSWWARQCPAHPPGPGQPAGKEGETSPRLQDLLLLLLLTLVYTLRCSHKINEKCFSLQKKIIIYS